MLPACDIYEQNCADPNQACDLATDPETGERYTGCRPGGSRNEGETCLTGGAGSCARGLICVSNVCRRVCKPDGAPGCPAPKACTGMTTGWRITFCQ
jgi:hypothetical protein